MVSYGLEGSIYQRRTWPEGGRCEHVKGDGDRCGNLGTCADHRCWLHSGTEAALRRRLAYRERHHHPDWRRPLPAPPVFPPIPRLTKAYLGLVFTAVEDLTA